ncbi:hypothetical protein BSL78_15888 [Apostichopus japonicus]|uniref:Uncharacterized protein n=1 Tax=Stichopus japonicus TaxID=307972 RepID=A0A2G8KGZ1_STIJA|nr:hypothetical protein BSL78_15888 [Apostichopus japonicus]
MATLTAEQTMSPFFGGATFEILGIRADLNLSSFYCPDEEYHLCVTLGKNPNSVPAFTLENGVSDPTQCQTSVLTFQCESRYTFNFTGVVVETTDVVIDGSQFVREREFGENVAFDLVVTSSPDGSAAQGDLLWSITTYVSLTNDGSVSLHKKYLLSFLGERYGATTATLSAEQVGLDIAPGATVTFGNIVTTMNLQSFSACPVAPAVLYFCAVLEKDSNPSRPFRLGGQLLGCVPIDCRGVVIISRIGTSDPNSILKEGFGNSDILIDIEYFADINGASVEGTDLWEIVVYANGDPEGRGEHLGETLGDLPINGENFPLRAERTVFAPVSATLSLTNSVSTEHVKKSSMCVVCYGEILLARFHSPWKPNQHSQTLLVQDLSAVVSVPANSNPLFRLDGFSNEPERLIGCQPTSCIGVRVVGGTITVPTSTSLIEGLQNHMLERVDVIFNTDSSGAGAAASGEDLWTIQVFLASDLRGGNPYSVTQATVPGSAASQTLIAGQSLNFASTSAIIDTRTLSCSSDPYICATLGAHPSRVFSLNGYIPETNTFDDDLLTVCTRINCDGVVIEQNVITIIEPAGSIFAREDNNFCLDVILSFAADGGSVVGTDLFEFEAYMSQNADGVLPVTDSVTAISLRADQTAIDAINGQSATFDTLKANLSLGLFNCPSGVGYVCVRVREVLTATQVILYQVKWSAVRR